MKEINRGFLLMAVAAAFVIGGLLGYGLNAGSASKSQSTGTLVGVGNLAKDTLKNKTVRGFNLTLQGTIRSVDAERIVLVKDDDTITVVINGQTLIARNVSAAKEATGASSQQERLKMPDLQVGQELGVSVQPGNDGSLIASDITVL